MTNDNTQGYREWFPDDPYPLRMRSIKNDSEFAKAIENTQLRTAVA